MSRVFVTGDTHGPMSIGRLDANNFPKGKELSKEDYVIICGDFGLIFDVEESDEEREWLSWLNNKPWTTLFIDGNHENFHRLNNYPVSEWHGGKVHMIRPSVIHLMRGQVFNINGYKWFTYGGAESVDRIYRVINKSWWPQETPSIDDYNEALKNLRKNNFKVDYIVTHAMPADYLEQLFYRTYSTKTPYQLYDFKTILNDEQSRCLYRDWFCGHYHMNYDFKKNFHMLYNKIVEVNFEKGGIK